MPTSSDTPVRKHFNYDSLDVSDAVFIQQQTDEILLRKRRAAQDMLEIGQRLLQVKARLKHGQFITWLEAEANMSQDTAQRMMNIAKFCEENPQFAAFADRFAQAAFYVVTAPSTSKPAREEALARAKAGEFITHKLARETKQRYSSPAPKQEQEVKLHPEDKFQSHSDIQSSQPTPSPAGSSAQFSASQPANALSAPASAQPRQRAVELPQTEPQIMAIRPQRSATSSLEQEEEDNPVAERPLERFVQSGTWWQLGEKHLLFCGDPTSQRFRERLPDQVAQSLAFPPSRDEWPQAPLDKVSSALALFTRYEQDQDIELFRQMIQSLIKASLLLYTGDHDVIVFSFLPDPGLILVAHELECRCYCAEPDPGRCEVAITAWRKQGFRAEKVMGLRF